MAQKIYKGPVCRKTGALLRGYSKVIQPTGSGNYNEPLYEFFPGGKLASNNFFSEVADIVPPAGDDGRDPAIEEILARLNPNDPSTYGLPPTLRLTLITSDPGNQYLKNPCDGDLAGLALGFPDCRVGRYFNIGWNGNITVQCAWVGAQAYQGQIQNERTITGTLSWNPEFCLWAATMQASVAGVGLDGGDGIIAAAYQTFPFQILQLPAPTPFGSYSRITQSSVDHKGPRTLHIEVGA